MTQFAFRADTITTSLPASDNFADTNSSVIITQQPSADQISDAINNIRFACTGSAGNGGFETALFTLNTRHTFRFQPQVTGRLTAHAHYMPQGGFSLVGRAPTGWFDGPGVVSLNIFARTRLRVRRANGTLRLNTTTPSRNLFHFSARGGVVADTNEGDVDSELLELFTTQATQTIVQLTDTIEVQARFTVQAFAVDGAEFNLDFASIPAAFGQPGDGLNSPFAVINISE